MKAGAFAWLAAFAIPPVLLAEIQAAAAEDHRPARELLRDVIEQGLENRRWQKLLAYGAGQAQSLGLTEADVPRLIAESRQERRPGRE